MPSLEIDKKQLVMWSARASFPGGNRAHALLDVPIAGITSTEQWASPGFVDTQFMLLG